MAARKPETLVLPTVRAKMQVLRSCRQGARGSEFWYIFQNVVELCIAVNRMKRHSLKTEIDGIDWTSIDIEWK